MRRPRVPTPLEPLWCYHPAAAMGVHAEKPLLERATWLHLHKIEALAVVMLEEETKEATNTSNYQLVGSQPHHYWHRRQPRSKTTTPQPQMPTSSN
ncbi:hypothetical protein NDU88_003814 [Pleurodeles waltl]|uniref:Uncharacterized protein n=1 Tax=Pleurodeles waltl TaxID=8319 RepID=A0AAV7W379_PLEWA|nr:hypothetical protein NDU88_003814 [Pleurodeles waltl]